MDCMELQILYNFFQKIDKMEIDNNKLKTWLFIAVLVLAYSTYVNIQNNAEINSMSKSLKMLDKNFEDRKLFNINKYDSLTKIVEARNNDFNILMKQQKSFSAQLNNLKIKSNEDKSYIISTTNADSLANIISRRYR